MTLAEWTTQVMHELSAAGFTVSEHQGFPLVKRPEQFADGVKLLKFRTTLPAERTIYADGMLFVPAGSTAAAHALTVRLNRGQ